MTGGQTTRIRVLPGSALSLTTPPPPPSSQPPLSEAILMEPNDECIRNFSRHCYSFYLSSLSPTSSNQSSLHSLPSSLKNEETVVGSTGDGLVQVTNDGKIILEAFERICAIGNNQITVQEVLQNEHDLCAKRHCDLLKECGLLETDRFTTLENAATLLQKYTAVRDAMRRNAHKQAMSHRQNLFFELLSCAEQDCLTYHDKCALPKVTTSNHTATTVHGIKAILSSLDKFVTKYQPKIGSHSFLAGLHKLIHLQLSPESGNKLRNNDPSYVVQWTFRGSVLTEACVPAAADGDELSYAREALKILFSFLIISKENDVEGGSPEDAPEPMVSFEIHKHVSNATLRRILKALPNPKDLDARATGSLNVMTKSDNKNIARENVDGHLDEPWTIFQSSFLADYCTIL